MKYIVILLFLSACETNTSSLTPGVVTNYTNKAIEETATTRRFIDSAKYYRAIGDTEQQFSFADSAEAHLKLSDEYVEKARRSNH